MANFFNKLKILNKTSINLIGGTRLKSSWWSEISEGKPDTIFGLIDAYNRDKNPNKVNLGIGVYRTNEGKPYVLQAVRMAEKIVIEKEINKEYDPIGGNDKFCKLAIDLALGQNNSCSKNKRNATVQTISGTGALRIGSTFLQQFFPGNKTIHVANPTWPNHIPIFNQVKLKVETFRYYDSKTYGIDLKGLLNDINKIPENSIIFFQASANNPTGVDPTNEEWREISSLVKKKKLLPYFDLVYQGFASGSIEKDAEGLRIFHEDGHQMAIAQSFAKNMGLYGERLGTFSLICNSASDAQKCISQLKILIRPMYSNPPIHGAKIATEILENPDIRSEWYKEVKEMTNRVKKMRFNLVENLKKAGSTRDWSHIIKHMGWFSYSGLNKSECEKLTKDFSIYLTNDGRIPIVQITPKNVSYIAEAIHKVIA